MTNTLDFNTVTMVELSRTELRETEGGIWGIVLAAVAIYAAGYAVGYCSTHPC